MTTDLVVLRGMEQAMLDMLDQPSFVHELMDFLTENTLSKLDSSRENGLLSLNNDDYLRRLGGLRLWGSASYL